LKEYRQSRQKEGHDRVLLQPTVTKLTKQGSTNHNSTNLPTWVIMSVVEGTSVATFSLDSSSLLLSPAADFPPPPHFAAFAFPVWAPSYNGPRTPSPPRHQVTTRPALPPHPQTHTHDGFAACLYHERCKPKSSFSREGVLDRIQ